MLMFGTIGWLLAVTAWSSNYSSYNSAQERASSSQQLIKMTSEGVIAKLQQAGITKDEVTRLVEGWKRALAAGSEIQGAFKECANLIWNGTVSRNEFSRNEFVACEALTQSTAKHQSLALKDSASVVPIIKSSKGTIE